MYLSHSTNQIRKIGSILVALLILHQSSQAQDKRTAQVRISPQTVSVRDAFSQLEAQAGLNFIYSDIRTELEKQVTFNPASASVKEILDQLAAQTKLRLTLKGSEVAVMIIARGSIRGTVSTSDGQPAGFVNIGIKGLRNTQADEQGHFTLENIEAGAHTVTASFVGLETQRQTVNVPANGTAELQFTLMEDAQTLQEVVVNGEKVNRFSRKETPYVARMPLKNLENPQVYNVVSKELLDEQLTTNINDALSNIPGSVVMNNPAGGIFISFRGFNGSVNARNGLQTASVRSTIDPVNVERIEAIKGPSGTLFQGLSSYGGVVNLVTKKPYEEKGGTIAYSFGSYGLSRTTVDYNAPLNDDRTALFRVNAALHREGSFKETGHNNTYTVAPSFLYKVNDRLELLADLEVYNFDQTRTGSVEFGPYKKATELPLQDRALAADDVNAEGTNIKSFLQANYQLSGQWTSSTNVAVIHEQLDNSYQPNYVFNKTGDSIYRNLNLYGPIYNKYLNIQQNFTGDFKIGQLRNRLLLGADYNLNTNIRNDIGRGLIPDTIAVANPTILYRRDIEAYIAASGMKTNFYYTETARYGAYASDVLNISDRLMAMLSLRVDRFEVKGDGGYGQTALSPKFGLVYQPVKDQVALFANWLDGFNNNNTANSETGEPIKLDPEHARQYEGGIKVNTLRNKLNATVSYYYIKIYNALLTDNQGYFLGQDGEQVSKGFDLDITANPAPGLNLVAGYSYNRNRYIRASNFEGKDAVNAPKNVANLWVSYRFQPNSALRHLGLGFGGNIVDDSFRDGNNTMINPGYTVLNGSLFYELDKWRLGLKLNNLTDKVYYSTNALLQNPRNVVANVSFNF